MQSYTVYKVSEHLKDRHPYIDNDNEKKKRTLNPNEVALAYNERAIPKLAALLKNKNLTFEKITDALITLNELVSNQELKVEMIENNIVLSACNLMVNDSEEVRCECAKLVGSLLSLDIGRSQFNLKSGNFLLVQSLIFDDHKKVRLAVGWLLCRLACYKEGVEMLVESEGTLNKMIEIIKHFSSLNLIEDNYEYIIYVLDSFVQVSMYDFGSLKMLNKNLLKVFYEILKNENDYSLKLKKGIYDQIRDLILNCLKNITLTKQGKIEAINENLILIVFKYLDSKIENERIFASSFFLSISNNLEGKNQITKYEVNGKYVILEVTKLNLIFRKCVNC